MGTAKPLANAQLLTAGGPAAHLRVRRLARAMPPGMERDGPQYAGAATAGRSWEPELGPRAAHAKEVLHIRSREFRCHP
jgi:hypothetical protein